MVTAPTSIASKGENENTKQPHDDARKKLRRHDRKASGKCEEGEPCLHCVGMVSLLCAAARLAAIFSDKISPRLIHGSRGIFL